MPHTTSVRAVAALISVGVVLTACSAKPSNSDSASAPAQQVPEEAARIMATDPYAMARWSYLLVDPATDEVIYSNNADSSMFLASQTKHFTVGTAYDTLGVDHTVTTPVYGLSAFERGVC
ncbi:D-alanyl-D-alanine carboxypeptidase [Rhodococcus erythropolis]|uniref:D-alanyl-D-alanine carboxypeptidase n=1 Tax=Rhodococcus erythropolis TaxID=1833 RepID=UPI0021C1738C|nr:D-alanyl-D-alanine carboxypeptidase [Rhodococcus erythropolis]